MPPETRPMRDWGVMSLAKTFFLKNCQSMVGLITLCTPFDSAASTMTCANEGTPYSVNAGAVSLGARKVSSYPRSVHHTVHNDLYRSKRYPPFKPPKKSEYSACFLGSTTTRTESPVLDLACRPLARPARRSIRERKDTMCVRSLRTPPTRRMCLCHDVTWRRRQRGQVTFPKSQLEA